jgi:signal transduction histidine kinase
MPDDTYTILFVEDDQIDQMAFERFARKPPFPYRYMIAGSLQEARALQETAHFDAIVTDYSLGDGVALDLFEVFQDTPIIVVTGIGNEEIAITAMKAGAYDYLIKDAKGNYLKTLTVTVENAIRRKEAENELTRYREQLEELVEVRTSELKREIEDRKQAETALQKARDELEVRVKERTAELSRVNAELARAARLKDEFLANMSHELRTPLNVILGMVEALQEKVYGSLNNRQLKSLRTVEESGRHLLTLINDVLDLSKIGAGKFALEISPVYVESVCQAALRMVKQIALKKHLTVTSQFGQSVKTIYADERRLKQILVNLLDNAVKFTPAGGSVGLEVNEDIELHVVHITVWDSGIGIAPEDIDHLFQPFVQLDASFSRRYEGTGLGLSLVYRLVEMHGGSITVESEVKKGSRFTLSLPWKEANPTEFYVKQPMRQLPQTSYPVPTDEDISPVSPEAPMVLIAEDNEATIHTLSEYLSRKGYRITIARNGREAFSQTKEVQPDIILMDIQMPEMDGLEAIRYIRADKQIRYTPIIGLTALAMPGDREKCLAAGADEYMSKPVSLRNLAVIVHTLLSNPPALSQEATI